MIPESNGHYSTSDLEEAAALHASGLRYHRTEWQPGEPNAEFIFDTLPESTRAAWATHTLQLNAHALFTSWNHLRNELEAARRRRVR